MNAHARAARRFDDPFVAADYARRKNVSTRRNRRELACVLDCLSGLPTGATVLDLPCGTGRLIGPLRQRGWQVVAADHSEHMLAEARRGIRAEPGVEGGRPAVAFHRADVLDTGFEDDTFDAVICNRLLHHYPDASERQQALRELVRISRGRVVVSYFSNVSLSAARFHASHLLRGRPRVDRVPIWPWVFRRDVEAAGLSWVSTHPVRLGLSPQTYVRLDVGAS